MDSTTSTGTTTSGSYTINMGEPQKQYGWVCPLCGRANAPWLNQCPCQPIKTWTFISPTAPLKWDPGEPYCTTTATSTKDGVTWSEYRATNE